MGGVVWGPLFVLGLIALSEILEPVMGLYIQHILSNLQIPAYLFATFKLYEVAMFQDSLTNWRLFTGASIINLITFSMQFYGFGTTAQYYLLDSDNADRWLY